MNTSAGGRTRPERSLSPTVRARRALAVLVAMTAFLTATLTAGVVPARAAGGDASAAYTVNLSGPSSVAVYDAYTYGVTVSAPSANSANPTTGVVLTVKLAAGTVFDSVPKGADSPVASSSYDAATNTVSFTLKDLAQALSSFNFSVKQTNNPVKDQTTVLAANISGSATPDGTVPSDSVSTKVTGNFNYSPSKSYSVVAGSDNRTVTYYFNVGTDNASSTTETFTSWAQELTDVLPAGARVTSTSSSLGSWTVTGDAASGQTATWTHTGQYGPSGSAVDAAGGRVWITVYYPDSPAFPVGGLPPKNTASLRTMGHDGTWHDNPMASAQSIAFGQGTSRKLTVTKDADGNGHDTATVGDAYWLRAFKVTASYLNGLDDRKLGQLTLTDSSLDPGNAEIWDHLDVYRLLVSFNASLGAADVPYTLQYQTDNDSTWQTLPGSRTTGTDLRLVIQTASSTRYVADASANATIDLPAGQTLTGWRVVVSPDDGTSIASGGQFTVQTQYVPMYKGRDGVSAPTTGMTNTAVATGTMDDGGAIDPASDSSRTTVVDRVPFTTNVTAPSTLTVGAGATYSACLANMSVNRSYADDVMQVVLPVGVQYDAATGVTRSNTTVIGTNLPVPDVGDGVTVTTRTVTDAGGAEHQVVTFTFATLPAMRPIGAPSDRWVENNGYCYTIPVTVLAQAYDPSDTVAPVQSFGYTEDPAYAAVPMDWYSGFYGSDTYDFDANRSRITVRSATSQVTTAGGLLISKQVRAGTTGSFATSTAVPVGGEAQWQVYVANVLPDPVSDVVLFDRLPVSGDGRDSQFPNTLAGALTGLPDGATVEYSTDATSATTGTWTTDPTGATAWRVTLPRIASGAKLTLLVPTSVPSGLAYGLKDTNDVSGTGSYHGADRTFGSNSAFVTVAADPAITLTKKTNGQHVTSAPGPALQTGSAVTWTYQVTNTGNTTLDPVTVTDKDADGNPVSVTCPSGPLAVGASITCQATGTAITGQYHNTAVVAGTPVDDQDQAIAGAKAPTATDQSWYHGAPATYEADKTSDPASGSTLKPGQKVTYTLRVKNTSPFDLPATVTDSLADVVDDATYNQDATATLPPAPTYADSALSWSGTIPAGKTLLITYSVTVDPDRSGNGTLVNPLIVDTGSPGDCHDAGDCGTTNPVVYPTPTPDPTPSGTATGRVSVVTGVPAPGDPNWGLIAAGAAVLVIALAAGAFELRGRGAGRG